jgi:hypothetical protein
MSRVALSQNNENYTETEAQDKLKHLVKDYLVNKEREKEFKDAASIQNTQIKVIMSELNIKEFETDNGKVVLSDRKTEDFNEERLIQFLKERGLESDIIKTKEYVDFDALESAIYHDIISGDNLKDMNSCKDVKVTQVLRINKK